VADRSTPGTGEALRLSGLTARIDTEAWAGAVVDWLETRRDVDPSRIGIAGWSLGGYYAPRAAAFEKRFALCVAWGANHNWGAVQRRRLEREGERPVPHYWEHMLWVWGHGDLDTFIEFADDVHLDGVVKQITVPFLIAHGSNDRQIPLQYAHPLLRPGGQLPQARAARLRPGGRRHRAHRPGSPALRQHLHRRLGGRHLRRARASCHLSSSPPRFRPPSRWQPPDMAVTRNAVKELADHVPVVRSVARRRARSARQAEDAGHP
jgi:hypothetical protein